MSYSRLSPERYENIASRAGIRRGVGATITGACARNLGTEGEAGALLRLWLVINGNFRTVQCHIVGSSLRFTMVRMDRRVRYPRSKMANIQVNACNTWVEAQGESWEEPVELVPHVIEVL